MNHAVDIINVGARSGQFFWALLQRADLQFSITRLQLNRGASPLSAAAACWLP